MTVSRYRISALLMLVILACYLSFHVIQQHHARAQDNISKILIRLQSRDASEVAEARVELAGMGDEAILPLIDLLRGLVNQNPDGASMTPADEQQRTAREKFSKDLDDATKSRVMNDIYEVLGHLRAAKAVPLLVSIMEKEEIDNMIQGMSPVMRSLAEIGSDAVPALIQCLEEARNTALASASLRPPDLNDEARRPRVDSTEGRIQLKAILVLGQIGDKRAIPALENIETSTENQFTREQAREAVQTIRGS